MVNKCDVDAALIKRDRLRFNGSFVRPSARVRLSQPALQGRQSFFHGLSSLGSLKRTKKDFDCHGADPQLR